MEQDHAAGNITPEQLGPGSVVDGRYRLASVASAAGAGVVYNALDERSRQRVRIRVTPHAPDPALVRLHHSAIPRVLDSGRVGRAWFCALEWFDGEAMELPSAPIGADPSHVRAWADRAMHLLDALVHVHQHAGRAHGDLGLHSLWVGRDGSARLIDVAAPDGPLEPGAVPYASPERLRGGPREPASDLYALAAVLYAHAYGSPPFGSDPVHARSGHLLREPPDAPAGVTPLPVPFVAVLRTALDKQPVHRFGSAARMREALRAAIDLVEVGRPIELGSTPALDRVAGAAWDDAETVKVERSRFVSAAPATAERSPVPVVERPWRSDSIPPEERADEEPTAPPDDGTLDSPPERTESPPRRPSRAWVAAAALGLTALGALAVTCATLVAVGLLWLRVPEPGSVGAHELAARDVAAPLSVSDEEPPGVFAPTPRVTSATAPVSFTDGKTRARRLATFPEFVALIRDWPGQVRLVGHTDSRGPAEFNLQVGLARAWAVRQLLVLEGLERRRLPIGSKGESEPIGDNATLEGRAANRRVTAEFEPSPGGVDPAE
ncbi:MAG: OmpA family protein [Myxococcota bacterium]